MAVFGLFVLFVLLAAAALQDVCPGVYTSVCNHRSLALTCINAEQRARGAACLSVALESSLCNSYRKVPLSWIQTDVLDPD